MKYGIDTDCTDTSCIDTLSSNKKYPIDTSVTNTITDTVTDNNKRKNNFKNQKRNYQKEELEQFYANQNKIYEKGDVYGR